MIFRKLKNGWMKCLRCGGKTELIVKETEEYKQIYCFKCDVPLVHREPGPGDRFCIINEIEMSDEP
ncbi:MAG: hypothetical protein ACYSTI_14045 [Planctomycetota bacterium]|jgi:hypothetical protein